MKSELGVQYEPAWEYQPDLCPADRHFIEYMQSQKERGLTILHVGTGGHHMVGKYLTPMHYVLGITLSPEEHASYIPLAHLTARYRVLFGDIYNLPLSLLPRFDVITLFHLGEIYFGEERLREQDTQHLIEHLAKMHLKYDGRIVAYRDSAASWALPLFERAMAEAFVNPRKSKYKSLDIYHA